MTRQQHAFLLTLEKKGEGEGGRESTQEGRGGREGGKGREGVVCVQCAGIQIGSRSLPHTQPMGELAGTINELCVYKAIRKLHILLHAQLSILYRLVRAFEAKAHQSVGMPQDTISGAIFVDGFMWSLTGPHGHSSAASPLSHMARVFETIHTVPARHCAVYLALRWWLEQTSSLCHGGTNWA